MNKNDFVYLDKDNNSYWDTNVVDEDEDSDGMDYVPRFTNEKNKKPTRLSSSFTKNNNSFDDNKDYSAYSGNSKMDKSNMHTNTTKKSLKMESFSNSDSDSFSEGSIEEINLSDHNNQLFSNDFNNDELEDSQQSSDSKTLEESNSSDIIRRLGIVKPTDPETVFINKSFTEEVTMHDIKSIFNKLKNSNKLADRL